MRKAASYIPGPPISRLAQLPAPQQKPDAAIPSQKAGVLMPRRTKESQFKTVPSKSTTLRFSIKAGSN
jgi:hypothetical protein